MPTNANTFNSRVTSEALEAKFRQVFPSQGGAELGQDLFASGVIQPVIDFSSVAEGSVLSQNLQTAWDFATGHDEIASTGAPASSTAINNTGFWKVDLACSVASAGGAGGAYGQATITDGLSSKIVFKIKEIPSGITNFNSVVEESFVIFLRAGDSFVISANGNADVQCWYRQIADVNGNLVNPLGFTFS